MAREVRLSDRQRRRATRMAREKGLACPACGSPEPVADDEGRTRPDGGAQVSMRCEDCENVVEMALVLSPEEAGALGLHSLGERGPRERPEAGR